MGIFFSLLAWADNLILIADTVEKAKQQISDIQQALAQKGFKLKMKESAMMFGMFYNSPPKEVHVRQQDGKLLIMPVINKVELLGTMLDRQGRTMTSWEHRRTKAEVNMGQKQKLFRSPWTSWQPKCRAFVMGPGSSAMYDSGTWTIDSKLLHMLKGWENNQLRSVMRTTWKIENEGRMRYTIRTEKLMSTTDPSQSTEGHMELEV